MKVSVVYDVSAQVRSSVHAVSKEDKTRKREFRASEQGRQEKGRRVSMSSEQERLEKERRVS